MRLKGSQLKDLWLKAKKTVTDIHGNPGGEIGDGLRARGYDVMYNGCSCCSFREIGLGISYGASCCDRPWAIDDMLTVYSERGSDRKIAMSPRAEQYYERVDPDEEVEVMETKSVAERFESGELKFDTFVVRDESFRTLKTIGEFSDFKKADEYARRRCQEEIDRLNKDPDWRRHTASCVRNNVQRARELHELRHYEDYNYDGYRYWISVVGERRNDD